MVGRKLPIVVALIVAVLAPAPAMAVDTTWHTAACYAGAIDSVEVTGEGQPFLRISGHLDCRTADKSARFGYARYDNPDVWGTMHPTDLRRYRNMAPTTFSEGRHVEDGVLDFSICVVTDYDVQVDCVLVFRADQDSPLEVTMSAVKELEYSKPVRIVGDRRPACGGCW